MVAYADVGKDPDHGRPEERTSYTDFVEDMWNRISRADEDTPRTLPGFYVCKRCGAFVTEDELRAEHCPAAPLAFHRTLDD